MEEEYWSRIHFFSLGRFSSVGSHRRSTGVVGGRAHKGHEHGLWASSTTPEFWQGDDPAMMLAVGFRVGEASVVVGML